MADDSLILEHLKTIQATQSQHGELLEDLRYRMSSVEQQIAGLRSDFAHSSNRTDSIEKRVERIERRLELRDDT